LKQGVFSKLAKQYINRPAYSPLLLNHLLTIIAKKKALETLTIVEVGAGTGKLTKMLLEIGLHVIAVEPNSAMREEGIKYTSKFNNVTWLEGSGEHTNVDTNRADWVIMASSFHWTDPNQSLPEFARVLKKDGYFTAIWNPRNIEVSEFHTTIEENIQQIVPELSRVSSGSNKNSKQWEYVLTSTGDFSDCFFMEMDHLEIMTKERYLGAWHSVNDIQAQAGEQRWEQIIMMIKNKIKDLNTIEVPYKIRAWTVQKAK
jgi:ubiquinone/menaquinone biosynthesis C-methylase UbiE